MLAGLGFKDVALSPEFYYNTDVVDVNNVVGEGTLVSDVAVVIVVIVPGCAGR